MLEKLCDQILEPIGVSSLLQFCPTLCLVYQNKSCTMSSLVHVFPLEERAKHFAQLLDSDHVQVLVIDPSR